MGTSVVTAFADLSIGYSEKKAMNKIITMNHIAGSDIGLRAQFVSLLALDTLRVLRMNFFLPKTKTILIISQQLKLKCSP